MKQLLGIFCLLIFSLSAQATSVSFLWGNTFNNFGEKDTSGLPNEGYEREKLTMTVEHFGLWEYGTVFFYFDLTEPFSNQEGDSNQYFGGISPTFSLSKITGKNISYGWIKDVSLRLELENGSGYGRNNFRNYFYGLQYDLAMPWFDFFSFNTVVRDNPESRGVGFQLGMFWQKTWEYSQRARFKFTGFIATSPWDGDQDPELTFFDKRGRYLTAQPQLLWDAGYAMFGKKDRIELGTEYAHFENRYQLKNVDERVWQAMIKVSW